MLDKGPVEFKSTSSECCFLRKYKSVPKFVVKTNITSLLSIAKTYRFATPTLKTTNIIVILKCYIVYIIYSNIKAVKSVSQDGRVV